jgi:hypothetical protein
MPLKGPHNASLHPDMRDTDVVALVAGAVTITFDRDDIETARRPHWQAAVEFYSDAAGETVVQPTAGTRVISVEVYGCRGAWQEPNTGASIDLATEVNQPAYWTSNSMIVRAVMTGIVGATHCRLRTVANGV